MSYPTDLEANFRPNPADANWLGNVPVSTRAVTYGQDGRSTQVYQDAYGTEVMGIQIDPLSVLVGGVIGIVAAVLYSKYKK